MLTHGHEHQHIADSSTRSAWCNPWTRIINMLPDGIDVFCHRLLMELGAVRSNGPLIGVQGHLAADTQLLALGQTHDVGAPGLAGIVREAVLGGVVITLDKTTDLQGRCSCASPQAPAAGNCPSAPWSGCSPPDRFSGPYP